MSAVRCAFYTDELGVEWRSSGIKRHRQIRWWNVGKTDKKLLSMY